jgi:hypothetical protein
VSFETLFDLVREAISRVAIFAALGTQRAGKRWNKDRPEEKGTPGCKSFLVSVTLILIPRAVRDL